MSDLTIIGDEAWTPEELAQRERRRVYHRLWRAANRERHNQYHRDYMWRKRHGGRARPHAALHELRCTGPHRSNRYCRPIPVYRTVGA